ncbi:hypothetical protein GE09DRAFT_979728 [Coniochaeta sp. 2T2.1]|nr:hypothetical protein GE09DRAFT_979728 [Coniochaeta sp. 2T2.1]
MPYFSDSPAFKNTTAKTFPDFGAAKHDWEETSHKTTGTARFIAQLPKWDTEKPFNLAFPLPRGQPKTNVIRKDHVISVADVRGRESSFALDVHGFAFASQLPLLSEDTVERDDMDTIAEKEIQRMQHFLKDMLGAKRVQAFDYTFREVKPAGDLYQWHEKRPPARNAHIDQTPQAAMSRLKMYFGEEADEVARGRIQLINLWRPLFGPLEETPLAILDARSLSDNDLMAQDMVHTHYLGENYVVKFNQNHRWYYWSKMQPNEGILIKNFDSEVDGRARACAHVAFEDHNTPPGARLRKSVEVRFIVLY